MNTKKLFFVSMIILSISMGLSWIKNRPKPQKVQPPVTVKTRQAIDFNEFQIEDEQSKNENENEEDDEEEENDESEKKIKKQNATKTDSDNESGEENQDKTPSDIGDKAENANILKDDPIMVDYFKITRNPFEISPYAKLVEKLKLEAEMAARPKFFLREEIKVPKLLNNAKFTGTIETDKGLAALIDGSLYIIGSLYKNYIIKDIKMNLIVLQSEKDDYLLPKTGVSVKIDNETGEYSLTDNFE